MHKYVYVYCHPEKGHDSQCFGNCKEILNTLSLQKEEHTQKKINKLHISADLSKLSLLQVRSKIKT